MITLCCHAARDLQVYGLVTAVITFNQFGQYVSPFIIRKGVANPHSIKAVLQAFEMMCQAKQAFTVNRYDFIDAIPEQEAPVHDGNMGFFKWQKRTV
jgi:hypothetical protein